MGISVSELEKSLLSLEEAMQLMKQSNLQDKAVQKALRDACIQRFEYCVELSWKTTLKVLGSTTAAAKPAVREMARNNLIQSPDLWLTFIDSRNETSHAYDEDVAQKVFTNIRVFIPHAKDLLVAIKRLP
ncbi:MAG: HI0074 family nucleotidyltransferase substrate-binding subunit [Pseudobdellovibrionaceae bacterium]